MIHIIRINSFYFAIILLASFFPVLCNAAYNQKQENSYSITQFDIGSKTEPRETIPYSELKQACDKVPVEDKTKCFEFIDEIKKDQKSQSTTE